jgi:hypothetical protein
MSKENKTVPVAGPGVSYGFSYNEFKQELSITVEDSEVTLSGDATVKLFHYLQRYLPQNKIWASKYNIR